jgi:hypothetical protein
MKKILLVLILGAMLVANETIAQGCCDAGSCSLSPFKGGQFSLTEGPRNEVSLGGSFGKGFDDISVLGGHLEYIRRINDTWSFGAKGTFNSNSGRLGDVAGLGDMFLNANYSHGENWRFTLGTKIPLSNGDVKLNGASMPMPYQPSLGIFDAIAGVSYRWEKIGLSAIYQQPLTKSANSYLRSSTDTTYLSTNKLNRKSDFILRAAYDLYTTDQLSIVPSLLGIIHTAEDTYTYAVSGVDHHEQSIEGSQGLTLNANIRALYNFKPNQGIELNAGFPLVVREAMPDGLTRSVVIALEYKFRF